MSIEKYKCVQCLKGNNKYDGIHQKQYKQISNNKMQLSSSLIEKVYKQDQLIAKLTSQETKLTLYVQQFHEAIAKKKNKTNDSAHNNTSDQKAEKLLQRQLQTAKVMLKNYQNQLRKLTKNKIKNQFTPQHLVNLDQEILSKEEYLKQLHQDIKNLTIVKRKQEKIIDKKQKNQEGMKLTKLIEDLRKQKDQLQNVKTKHKQAEEALERRKLAVVQLEKVYLEKCVKNNQKPINFEEFKQKRSQQFKEKSINKNNFKQNKKEDKKKQMSVREIINGHLDQSCFQPNEKTLSELHQKKAVAQNSLKIARKKYDYQILQLKGRLQDLKEQNIALQNKLSQKRKEKQAIEFEKSNDNKKSAKAYPKLDPIGSRLDSVSSKLDNLSANSQPKNN